MEEETIIHNLRELAEHIGVGEENDDDAALESRIRRPLFKYTDCGIGFAIFGHKRYDFEAQKWLTLGPPTGVVVSGYCEGVDAECPPHELEFPFTVKEWNAAVEEADRDGCQMWDDTHGCDECGEEDEFGYRRVNKACSACQGGGKVF